MKALKISAGVVLLVVASVWAVSLGVAPFQGASDAWWGAWLLGVLGAGLIYVTVRRPRRSRRPNDL